MPEIYCIPKIRSQAFSFAGNFTRELISANPRNSRELSHPNTSNDELHTSELQILIINIVYQWQSYKRWHAESSN